MAVAVLSSSLWALAAVAAEASAAEALAEASVAAHLAAAARVRVGSGVIDKH